MHMPLVNKLALLACLILFPLLANASPQEELFQLIDARLQLMQQVAAYKWLNKQPIEDKAREKVVLDSAGMTALQLGLRLEASRVFFQAQIDAAKEIEQYWFKRYAEGHPPGSPPDLDKDIRPKLLNLGQGITEQLSALPQAIDDSWQGRFLSVVKVEGLSDASRLALFKSLTQVSHYRNRLDQILDTRELRVGTTGDYAPFSSATDAGYRGIDIDMAQDLADALGAHLTLVQTSWPMLVKDLIAGNFDIAMSGISRNTERAKFGYFSAPYYHGGKTPIARCDNAKKFSSLEAIDAPDVHVIVNKGGTNEAWARANIKHAQLTVFDDNTKIFDELVAGHADVMVTDAIEVKLQTQRQTGLCATMPGKTLTYLDKAYLMPQDDKLRTYVNTWLGLRMADGTVDRTFARYIK